jgi:hypothetical protein
VFGGSTASSFADPIELSSAVVIEVVKPA